jgi:hypothetical protein
VFYVLLRTLEKRVSGTTKVHSHLTATHEAPPPVERERELV